MKITRKSKIKDQSNGFQSSKFEILVGFNLLKTRPVMATNKVSEMRSTIGNVEGPELADWVFDGGSEESENVICILVNTPQGILEISSGLLGRHNIYNILAAVSVGIAVGAPLEDIVRGMIEEVDGVPCRCELIDGEQAFGVIVDYAHTIDALL